MQKARYRIWLTMMVLPCIGAQAQAQAQAIAPPAAGAMPAPSDATGDIIVTAQRRAQRLQDVPVSVSVVSGAALERGNIRTLQDISSRLPDVKISAGQSADSLNIRGTGSGTNPGFEQSVATFVDGLYRPRSRAVRAALFDIEQIEVLKGPQTTFFGANAIAGALNITTRKPSQTTAVNITALYGTDNEVNLEGGLTAPLTDTLSARVAVRFYGMDDNIDNAYARDRGRLRELTGRLSLRWEPAPNFRSDLRVEADRLRDRTAFDNELLNCPADPAYPAAANVACLSALARGGGTTDDRLNGRSDVYPGYLNNDYVEIGLTNALTLGTLTFSSITGYYDSRNRLLQDLVPTAPSGPDLIGSGLVPAYEHFDQFSQELRVQSPVNRPVEFLAGLYYSKSHLNGYNLLGLAFAPLGAIFASIAPPGSNPLGYDASTRIGLGTFTDQRQETKSAFGAITLRPFAHVRVNAGLRYTSVNIRAARDYELGAYGAPVIALDNFVPAPLVTQAFLVNLVGGDLGNYADPTRHDDQFMPSAGIQYDVSRDLMLYASYARGFKSGGFGGLNVIETFGPEHVDAYEIGAKGAFADRRGSFSIALFRNDFRDLQESSLVNLPSGVGIALTTNAASSRAQGVELSTSFRPFDVLTLNADVAYLDSKYLRFPNGACTVLQSLTPNCSNDLSGKPTGFAPKFSGSIGASLRVPVGGWHLQVDPVLSFTSSYFEQSNADPLFRQGGYSKVDLRVGAAPAGGRWEVAAIGKNLTDRRTAGYRASVPASLGSVSAFPERGRSLALQITYRP